MHVERWIEGRFGYGAPWCHLVTFIVGVRELFQLLAVCNFAPWHRRIFISFSPTVYLEPLKQVIPKLEADGWKVILFAEREIAKATDVASIHAAFPSSLLIQNASRAMPLLRCEAFWSSVAGKHAYFPRSSIRIFYFHSLAGLAGFPVGGLDSYTHFFCGTTQQHLETLHHRENLGLSTNGVFVAGYPRYDDIESQIRSPSENVPTPVTSTQIKVIYAPTYVDDNIYASSSSYPSAIAIVKTALRLGFHVVFRPHPLTDPSRYADFATWFTSTAVRQGNGMCDYSPNYVQSYAQCDIMITDVSGTAVVFSQIFRKPVVFYCSDETLLQNALENWPDYGIRVADTEQLEAALIAPVSPNPKHLLPYAGRAADRFCDLFTTVIKDQ